MKAMSIFRPIMFIIQWFTVVVNGCYTYLVDNCITFIKLSMHYIVQIFSFISYLGTSIRSDCLTRAVEAGISQMNNSIRLSVCKDWKATRKENYKIVYI